VRQFHFSLILCGQSNMRITLMHNPKAGHGKHRKKELMDALAKSGHEVIYQSTKKSRYKKALKKSTDLVIAAGGDGTSQQIIARLESDRCWMICSSEMEHRA
jgi:diacylglycerol kinase family enzyme